MCEDGAIRGTRFISERAEVHNSFASIPRRIFCFPPFPLYEPRSSDEDDTCELAPPLLTTTPQEKGGRLSSRQRNSFSIQDPSRESQDGHPRAKIAKEDHHLSTIARHNRDTTAPQLSCELHPSIGIRI
ncbi:hypothetical protein TNCV_3474571 [Trichonephila clavipes]|nr:hypothetical protein TNCV_3474571 [Trichonephila clavipes]